MDTTASAIKALPDSAKAEDTGLSEAQVKSLLAATDQESIAELMTWLKEHSTTFAPTVTQAIQEKPGMSGEASCVVLDALLLKPPADEEITMMIMNECLTVIADRITTSLADEVSGADSLHDDPLVSSAVAVVTAGRRSHLSETAVSCLAKSGTGGALVLVRSFDTLRDNLKLYVLRRLKPAAVWELGGNVVISLGNSISKLIEGLEGKPLRSAIAFLDELAPDEHSKSSEISPTDPVAVGDHVFHATWGVGEVVKSSETTITVDFGSAGTRTLLRKFATLRHSAA